MGLGRTVVRYLFFAATTALVVTLAARLWDEILAGADRSEQIELERTVLPGISIRS